MMFSENAIFSSKKTKEMLTRATGAKTMAVPGRKRILHSNDLIIAPYEKSWSYKASCSIIESCISDRIGDGCMFCLAVDTDIPRNF
jgi:hypothetical protein